MEKGHRIPKRLKRKKRNRKDTRPSAKLSLRKSIRTEGLLRLDAIRGKKMLRQQLVFYLIILDMLQQLKKLLKSAIANAENNNGMDPEQTLYIAECYASNGPTMKRVQPRAQGRAYRIEKRMSHITIVLE